MFSNSLKLIGAALLCVSAGQAQTQMVTQSAKGTKPTFNAQVGLKNSISIVPRPWETSVYSTGSQKEGLKNVFERTATYIKSPLRLQRFGGMDGGGGNALVCSETKGFEAQLLDLYEAEQLGIKLDFGPGQSFEEKIDYVLNRLAKISPARAATYKAMAYDLLTQETQWVENKQMPIIDDVNLTTFPQGCLLVQVAVQRPLDQSKIPNAKTYVIDKDMFSLLDEESKAGLILHEVLYREARFSKKENSVFTRHLLGVIASSQVEKLNLASFNKMLSDNKIGCLEGAIAPVMFNSKLIEGAPVCEYLNHLDYTTAGRFQFVIPEQLRHVKEAGGYTLDYRGTFGSGLFDVTQATHMVLSLPFNGSVKVSSSSAQLPEISIKNGNIGTAYSYPAGILGFNDLKGAPETTELFINPIKALNKWLYQSTSSYSPNRKFIPIVALSGKIQIHHPRLKLVPQKCEEDEVVDCETDTILIQENSLTLNRGNSMLMAHVGQRPDVTTKNGWIEVDGIDFAGDKISSVYYCVKKMDPNGKTFTCETKTLSLK